jgi:tight adherence protein B
VIGDFRPPDILRFGFAPLYIGFAETCRAAETLYSILIEDRWRGAELGMVGRELGDPVGSEFGMVLDELTYGLDFETVLRNLYHRVGQEDLGLMVTAVSLQSSTGGNLSEVLNNLSRIIRERFKLRRKVRALSAEGRVSAYGLASLPAVLFLALQFIAPGYYGDIWEDPLVQPALMLTVAWCMVGIFIMYKMVNFKY